MGILEKNSRNRKRKAYIEQALLATVATAGLVGVALVAPGVLYAVKKLGIRIPDKFENRVHRTRTRLLEEGYIKFDKTPRGTFVRLTQKGEARLRHLEVKNFVIEKTTKWDGRYRMVIFDIKEKRRVVRGQIRMTLQQIGFLKLQNSVWVYPYDCEDLLLLLKADYHIGKEVLYLIVDSIENDQFIKNYFGLK